MLLQFSVKAALHGKELISALAEKNAGQSTKERAISMLVVALGDNLTRAVQGCGTPEKI